MFKVIGEVVGRLFGTQKAVDNLIDKDKGLLVKAGGWLGNLHYTSEDKAENDQQTREWGIRQLDAMAPFKVVQRILATVVASMWAILGLNIILAIWIRAVTRKIIVASDGTITVIEGINAVDDLLKFAFSDYMFWPTCVVFALYFAGGVLPNRSK